MAEEAIDCLNITFKVMTYCEVRAENEGTVVELHTHTHTHTNKQTHARTRTHHTHTQTNKQTNTRTHTHTHSRPFSINVWRKLIMPSMKFSTLNYTEQDNRLVKSI